MSRTTMSGKRAGEQQLDATVRDRLRTLRHNTGPRLSLFRKLAAVALLLVAAVLALWPQRSSAADEVAVVVANRDLRPGRELGPEDVAVQTVPAELVPAGALKELDRITGRVLAGAAREGEILTDVSLAGRALTRITTGNSNHAAVPVRLSDPGVAELLYPGRRVDVIAAATRSGKPEVLVSNAPVIAVRPAEQDTERGQLIVVGIPQDSTAAVASASLRRSITVALR